MSEASKKLYGFMLINEDSVIQRAFSSATYEQTLDGKLTAHINNWTYIPMDFVKMIDQLKEAGVYEVDGSPYDPEKKVS